MWLEVVRKTVGIARAGLVLAALVGGARSYAQCGQASELQKLTSVGHSVFENAFGQAIDVSGTTAVIGVPESDYGGLNRRGAAYVYVLSGTEWVLQARLIASDGQSGDSFGWSVAVDGDRIVVGAPFRGLGAVYTFQRSGTIWSESSILTLNSLNLGGFGTTVDLSLNRLVIGDPSFDDSPGASDPIRDSGRAYIYNSAAGGAWTLETTLNPPTPSNGGNYGCAVSLVGNDLVVGQHGSHSFVSSTDSRWNNSVCTYRRSGSSWTFQQELRPASPYQFDEFGFSVAIAGNALLIGAPGRITAPGMRSGAAFVFTRSSGNGSWTERQVLIPSDISSFETRFGEAVALASETDAAIGAPWWTPGLTVQDHGAMYRFQAAGGVWSQKSISTEANGMMGRAVAALPSATGATVIVGASRVSTPDRALGGEVLFFDTTPASSTLAQIVLEPFAPMEYFGNAVAIDGDWAVVGAPGADTQHGIGTGAIHIYHRVAGLWVLDSNQVPSVLTGGDAFGTAVSISGSVIAASAPLYDNDPIDGGIVDGGVVFIYQWTGDTWALTQGIEPANVHAQDHYGSSVSVKGNRLVVGADRDDSPEGTDAGAVYIYQLASGQFGSEVSITPFQIATGDGFGCAVSVMSDTRVAVGARYNDHSGANAGCAYLLDLQPIINGQAWTVTEEFYAADGAAGDNFGASIATSGIDTVVVGSPHSDGTYVDQGAGYVFRSGLPTFNNWDTGSKLSTATPGPGDAVGFSVGISSGTVVLGMPFDSNAGGSQAGAALLFRRVSGVWTEMQRIGAPDRTAFDHFGSAVAISGPVILCGAPEDDNENGVDAGAVYSFDYLLGPPSSAVASGDTTPCYPADAVFTVSPGGAGPFTYQWFRNGVSLVNTGGQIAGATTPTLTVIRANSADRGLYTCRVDNPCGSLLSNALDLQSSEADINCSLVISVQDIFDFLALYFAHDNRADVNGSSTFTVQDIFDFLAAYFRGG